MAEVTLEAHFDACGATTVGDTARRLLVQEMIIDRAVAALLIARGKEPANLIDAPERAEAAETYHMMIAIIAGLAEAGVINFIPN